MATTIDGALHSVEQINVLQTNDGGAIHAAKQVEQKVQKGTMPQVMPGMGGALKALTRSEPTITILPSRYRQLENDTADFDRNRRSDFQPENSDPPASNKLPQIIRAIPFTQADLEKLRRDGGTISYIDSQGGTISAQPLDRDGDPILSGADTSFFGNLKKHVDDGSLSKQVTDWLNAHAPGAYNPDGSEVSNGDVIFRTIEAWGSGAQPNMGGGRTPPRVPVGETPPPVVVPHAAQTGPKSQAAPRKTQTDASTQTNGADATSGKGGPKGAETGPKPEAAHQKTQTDAPTQTNGADATSGKDGANGAQTSGSHGEVPGAIRAYVLKNGLENLQHEPAKMYAKNDPKRGKDVPPGVNVREYKGGVYAQTEEGGPFYRVRSNGGNGYEVCTPDGAEIRGNGKNFRPGKDGYIGFEMGKAGGKGEAAAASALSYEPMDWSGNANSRNIMLPHIVDPKLARLEARAQGLRGIQVMAGTVAHTLNNQAIPFRLGGSLAARLKGAGRTPGDIDIEVGSRGHLQAAHQALGNLDAQVTMNGETWHVKGIPAPLAQDHDGGGVQLAFTDPRGHRTSVSIDLTNENNAIFNGRMHSPEERGVLPKGLTGKDGQPRIPKTKKMELVMNYLNRITSDSPEYQARSMEKGDMQQIASLLRADGINPTTNGNGGITLAQNHINWIGSMISSFSREGEGLGYEIAMGNILYQMATGVL